MKSGPRMHIFLALVDLICMCCRRGHHRDSHALAQELLPLPMLLKILGQRIGLTMLALQDSLLQSLRVIWWARHLVTQQDTDGESSLNCWHDMYWVAYCSVCPSQR